MKKNVFTVAILMGLGLNVNADTAIDKQINSTQQFVVVGTPTYNGYRFLAQTAEEEYNGDYSLIVKRAAEICKLMGLGTPMVYTARRYAKTDDEADNKWVDMYELQDDNLVLSSYHAGLWTGSKIVGVAKFIDGLSCKKK